MLDLQQKIELIQRIRENRLKDYSEVIARNESTSDFGSLTGMEFNSDLKGGSLFLGERQRWISFSGLYPRSRNIS
jgi:hypothetical protein